MPAQGPTRRTANTNTSTTNTNSQPRNKQALAARKALHSQRSKSFRLSRSWLATFGILLLCGSGCLAWFRMGLFSFLRPKSSKASAVLQQTPERTLLTSASSATTNMDRTELENRLRGALWGFFAGDALASPTHWFYGGRRQVVAEYGRPIAGYTKPNKRLSGSILNKSDPNGGGRRKGWFGGGSSESSTTIIGDVINHGKLPYWDPSKSYHYHATLARGENTLEATLARVLMRSIVASGGSFDPDHFRSAYVEFMQTPGSHNDTYASTCHRMFFANLIFGKLDPKDCPDNDSHNVDTIDGLVLPTIAAMAAAESEEQAARLAAACAGVTRKSKVLETVAGEWTHVVRGALRNRDADAFAKGLGAFARQTIHRPPNPNVDEASTMSACYLGQSLPGLIDLVAKHTTSGSVRVWEALLGNANTGGENVHRGSVLGAVLGARAGAAALPAELVEGLAARDELATEIDAFVRAVLPPVLPGGEHPASAPDS